MITDLSRGTPLPEGKSKTFADHAEELLAHFAGIDKDPAAIALAERRTRKPWNASS